MLETILASIVSYIGTNIDDIFINTIFYSTADTKCRTRAVGVGVFLGMAALTSVSIAGAYGLGFLPDHFIGLLGLIPIALGIKEIIEYRKNRTMNSDSSDHSTPVISTVGVMLVTIAGGADNIGVYVPLFVGFSAWQITVTIVVFTLLTAALCLVAKRLSDLPQLRRVLIGYHHIIVPTVYIVLGAYIISKGFICR